MAILCWASLLVSFFKQHLLLCISHIFVFLPINFKLFVFIIFVIVLYDLEKAMAPHSSTPAWEIPWAEEPGSLQSTGSLSQTRLNDFTFTFHFHALEKEMATHSQCSCLENPRDRGAWWATVYGVAQSRIWLKRLNSSSSSDLIGVCLLLIFLKNMTGCLLVYSQMLLPFSHFFLSLSYCT